MPVILMQIQSAAIVGLMFFGILKHRQRILHKKIMISAILWDIILILQIELSRGAILKASEALENPFLLNLHVSLAIFTVIFYVVMLVTGFKLISGAQELLTRHRWIGRLTFLLRVLTFITSFWAVAPK